MDDEGGSEEEGAVGWGAVPAGISWSLAAMAGAAFRRLDQLMAGREGAPERVLLSLEMPPGGAADGSDGRDS